MSVKCVRKWEAEDGTLHNSQREAVIQNAQYKILKNLRTLLDKAGQTGINHITLLNDAKLAVAMRDELNNVLHFHREYTGKISKRTPSVKV